MYTMATLRTGSSRDKESYKSMVMVLTPECSTMINLMGLASLSLRMETFIRVNLKMDSSVDLASSNSTTYSKALLSQLVIKATLRMVSSTV